ncbi:MAG: pentapeptide repeat-containing protein [Nitrospinota bacterium]|nr:pentapeptide repeat-containing protein [Nitrospinota bacterium]
MKILTLCFVVLVLMTDAFAFNQDHLKKVKNQEDCEKCDLSGANLQFIKMNHLDLRGTNFSGASFLYTEMRGSNLEGADFSNAQVNTVRFHKANLKNAVFRGSMIFRSHFYKADVRGADFSNTNLAESEFEYARTDNALWKNAKFCKTRFTNDLKNEGCSGRYRIDPSVYPKEKTEMDRLIDKWEKLYATCRGEYGKVREIACNKLWNVQDKLRGMNLCKGRYSWYNLPGAFMLTRRTWLPCRYKRLVDE